MRLLLLPVLFAVAAALGCPGGATSPPSEPARTDALRSAEAPPAPSGDCRVELWTGDSWQDRGPTTCGSEGRIGVLVAGDVGWAGDVLDATVAAMEARCATGPCDLGVLAGDLLYGDGLEADARWRAVWDGGFATLNRPFAAVLGNHEWRHEPNSKLKRKAVFGADKRLGLLAPGPSYTARIRDAGGQTLLAIAGLDTDSISNPGRHMPGLGAQSLATACALGAPVLWLGHHPPSSEGLHHEHEAHVEAELRKKLVRAVAGGCRIAAAVAGHDHDLQAWGPGCEEAGMPGVVVSGVAARGFRPPGPKHLRPCPADASAAAAYHAGPKATGGYAHLAIDTTSGHTGVELIEATGGGASTVLSSHAWDLPSAP